MLKISTFRAANIEEYDDITWSSYFYKLSMDGFPVHMYDEEGRYGSWFKRLGTVGDITRCNRLVNEAIMDHLDELGIAFDSSVPEDKSMEKYLGLAWYSAIWMNPDCPKYTITHTLIHEFAHVLLKHCGMRLPINKKELEAESVSYIVQKAIGYDSWTRSQQYIAECFLSSGRLKENARSSYDSVLNASQTIIDGLQKRGIKIAN